MGLFQNFIRNAVVSALGAKLARRSPIVGALVALLLLALSPKRQQAEARRTRDG